MRGRQVFMETLVAHGVDRIFGNPGTTESPLLDSLPDYPSIEYIVHLHEGVAVGQRPDAFHVDTDRPFMADQPHQLLLERGHSARVRRGRRTARQIRPRPTVSNGNTTATSEREQHQRAKRESEKTSYVHTA